MSLLFGFLDLVLILIMLFDTLGLIYQFRKNKESVKPKEYIRICFSWILFLTIYNTFSCSWKGFFGTLIRLILFAAKAYVTIPLLGGSTKLHKILIEDGKAEACFYKILDLVKSKICKCESEKKSISDYSPSETTEPENSKVASDNQPNE